MTTFDGREIRLLVIAASQINLSEIDITGPDSDEMRSVIYKAKSLVTTDDRGRINCKALSLRGDR